MNQFMELRTKELFLDWAKESVTSKPHSDTNSLNSILDCCKVEGQPILSQLLDAQNATSSIEKVFSEIQAKVAAENTSESRDLDELIDVMENQRRIFGDFICTEGIDRNAGIDDCMKAFGDMDKCVKRLRKDKTLLTVTEKLVFVPTLNDIWTECQRVEQRLAYMQSTKPSSSPIIPILFKRLSKLLNFCVEWDSISSVMLCTIKEENGQNLMVTFRFDSQGNVLDVNCSSQSVASHPDFNTTRNDGFLASLFMARELWLCRMVSK